MTPVHPITSLPATNDPLRCGTLVYTRASLFTLFAWMLWGDFSFTLMEEIWKSILPLVLKSEGAPNTVTALVMTTIPQVMNFIFNPIISTVSDRFRSRWGRRIPFLFFSAPFITIFLILLGFSRELGSLLHGAVVAFSPSLTPAMVTVSLICVLIVCFRFFELFVATVFYYLFNDVVPQAFIGRFLGLYRVIGALVGALFNFFIFKYATTHTSLIFFAGALLYGMAFLLMSLNVKEGQYPPPEPMAQKVKKRAWEVVKTYFRECFSHRIFRLLFTYSALQQASGAINIFLIFMALSIGLTMEEVGKVAGVAGIVGMVLMYPMGALVDRFHPLRVKLFAQVMFCLVCLLKCVFLFHDFPRDVAFWIYAALAGLSIPILAANTAATLPMIMRIFPHERFGQFSAANAMCGAAGAIVGGLLAGLFLDLMKRLFSASGDYYYRFVPLWSLVFMLLASASCFLAYREWKRLGGDRSYQSPVADNFSSFHNPS